MTNLQARAAGAGAIRIDEARRLASTILNQHEVADTNAPEHTLYTTTPQHEDLVQALKGVASRSQTDTVVKQDAVPGLQVRQQTMTLLDRADVSIDDVGRLRITSPTNQAGGGEEKLKTIHDYFAQRSTDLTLDGAPLNDDQVKQVVQGFLLQLRSGMDQSIAALLQEPLGERFSTQAFSGTPSRLEMAVRVGASSLSLTHTQVASIGVGPLGAPIRTLPYAAQLQFRMPLDSLVGAEPASAERASYTDVEFAVGAALDQLTKTADDQLEDTIRQRRQEAKVNAEKYAFKRQIEEQNMFINRGPQMLQPGGQ